MKNIIKFLLAVATSLNFGHASDAGLNDDAGSSRARTFSSSSSLSVPLPPNINPVELEAVFNTIEAIMDGRKGEIKNICIKKIKICISLAQAGKSLDSFDMANHLDQFYIKIYLEHLRKISLNESLATSGKILYLLKPFVDKATSVGVKRYSILSDDGMNLYYSIDALKKQKTDVDNLILRIRNIEQNKLIESITLGDFVPLLGYVDQVSTCYGGVVAAFNVLISEYKKDCLLTCIWKPLKVFTKSCLAFEHAEEFFWDRYEEAKKRVEVQKKETDKIIKRKRVKKTFQQVSSPTKPNTRVRDGAESQSESSVYEETEEHEEELTSSSSLNFDAESMQNIDYRRIQEFMRRARAEVYNKLNEDEYPTRLLPLEELYKLEP